LQATPNPKQAITNQPVLLKATKPIEMNLRFPGQYFDAETGLFYNWNRYYNDKGGRYAQFDPTGLDDGPNGYVYGRDDPLALSDPMGLKTMQCTKPLNALKEKFGTEFSRFARDWIPAAYHQYSCVVGKDGKVTCGGQDHAESPLRGPGKPSVDTLEGGQCKEVEPDNDGFEQCVLNEWKKPRPTYGIPFGTDCQEYDEAIIKQCRIKFAKKRKSR
ncbi:RHS repeat-associated core domain-containing protein, partial [Caenimonas koreensis]|uniref:RHS repeat-associated core domain-containing protein n=1 Tax=Caenimonas koreensis TaxID=367474 RepID=UPI00188E62E7